MFRKKITVLEKSFRDAGIDLSRPLGKCLLTKMLEHGYRGKAIFPKRYSTHKLDIIIFGEYAEDGSEDWVGRVDLLEDSYGWTVMVWGKDGPYSSKWHNQDVYSEFDLFGNRINNV